MKRVSDTTPVTQAKRQRIKPAPEISEVATETEQWGGDTQQIVRWSSQGDVPQVDILLYSGKYLLKTLCRRVINTNSVALRVPVGLTPGPYVLRVASNINRHDVYSDSRPIQIDAGAMPPAITEVAVQQTQWAGGSQQHVMWKSQGSVEQLKIELYQGHHHVKTLSRRAPNLGFTSVTVPNGLTPGTYTLRVASSAAESVWSSMRVSEVCSTVPVDIDAGVVPPGISSVVVHQTEWSANSDQQVSWSSQGSVPSVDLILYRGDYYVKTLGRNVPNTGSFALRVPLGLTPGPYQLRVASNVIRQGVFEQATVEIDRGAVPPTITDVTVQRSFVAENAVPCHAGSRQRLTWGSQGDVPSVHAQLYKGNAFVTSLFRNAPNTGSSIVTVPVGLSPGSTYAVRVVSSANIDAYGHSNHFAIDDEHRERCVHFALLLIRLPAERSLPYAIIRKIAVLAATD